jgi:hypothetical protein
LLDSRKPWTKELRLPPEHSHEDKVSGDLLRAGYQLSENFGEDSYEAIVELVKAAGVRVGLGLFSQGKKNHPETRTPVSF